MGGSIAVTIREEDGTMHKMCRWTNSTPNFVNDEKLFLCDKQHLQDYLKTWYEMVEDYDSGQNKLNMSSVYAPVRLLAPVDYGLLLIDYKTKTLLNMQGYTDYGRLLATEAGLSNLILKRNGENNDFYFKIEALHKSGRLMRAETLSNKEIDLSKMSLEKILESCDRSSSFFNVFKHEKREVWFEIFLKTDPWQFKRYEENVSGLKKLKEAVLELGFILTEEEEKEWKEYENFLKLQETDEEE